jgi:hypothetical protein
MSENRDETTGQFTPSEPLTGRARLEHEAGFRPMPDPQKQSADDDGFSAKEAGEILSATRTDKAPAD